jgi:hypothetical protein
MLWGLKRYQQTGDIDFITFSCYRRAPLLGSAPLVRRFARHYATGEEGAVEIESHWTARRREQLDVYPVVRRRNVG